MNVHRRAAAGSVSSEQERIAETSSISGKVSEQFLIDSLSTYAVFAVSPQGVVLTWNGGARNVFGYEPAEIIGKPFAIIFSADDRRDGEPLVELRAALDGTQKHHDRWHRRKDGTHFWGINTVEPIFSVTRELLGFTKLVRDMSEQYVAAQEIADSEQRLRMLIESVGDTAILSIDLHGNVRSWNAGAQSIFGYTHDEMIERPFSTLFSSDEAHYATLDLEKATHNRTTQVDRWLKRSNGSRFLASGKVSTLKAGAEDQPRGFVCILHDATAGHAVVEDLRRRAQFDELTDLPTRRAFHEHLTRAIGLLRRRASTLFAVLFVDLDEFKAVNDTYGHLVADKLLTATARRLERCVRLGDVVARIGGDEFAVLLNAIGGLTDATDAAERIGLEMRRPEKVDGADVCATVSIGIAMGHAEYGGPDEVLRDADAAMYVAKQNGRARAVVFDPLYGDPATDLIPSLRRAIERNELRLVYQPIVALTDSGLSGFEALLRWDHPRRGLLLPDAFIPQAEANDIILAIDRWVLNEACRQIMDWRANGLDPELRMSVNVSAREFSRSEFLGDILRVLSATGLPPNNLRMEITENVIVEQSDQARATLAGIRALGVLIDVDDFGTGFSSLGSLQLAEVDAIKIDSSFVSRIETRVGAALLETIIDLARKLGIDVIAEGIERLEQGERLKQLGCRFGQGLHFAAPLHAQLALAFASGRDAGGTGSGG